MTYNQFKQETRTRLRTRLTAIQNGDVKWLVHNQFDEHIIERALFMVARDARSVVEAYKAKFSKGINPIDLAYAITG